MLANLDCLLEMEEKDIWAFIRHAPRIRYTRRRKWIKQNQEYFSSLHLWVL